MLLKNFNGGFQKVQFYHYFSLSNLIEAFELACRRKKAFAMVPLLLLVASVWLIVMACACCWHADTWNAVCG